jgi:hypothetical protein
MHLAPYPPARPSDPGMRFGHVLLTTFSRRPNTREASRDGARVAEDWLHEQWRLFAELTVPSVAAQSECDFTWVVTGRPDSPDWFRALADTVRIGPAVHFSFSPNDPFPDLLADGSADALLVTRARPAGALHRRAMERIREDCEADPYTSEAVTLTDGYLLDHAARRIRPYHSLRAPLCTSICLEPARGALGRGGRRGGAPRGFPARSISEGEPMFALLAPKKQRPGRAGRSLDGRWLAARATADILDRDFGLALAGDGRRGPPGPGLRARPASEPGWLPSRPAAHGRQRVVVSIPCFQAWGSLARAVESVLDQTHGDLLVVVANDGDDHPRWDVLGHIRDPRLVRVDYEANRGRHFADQVALMARLGHYLLIHGADEWSEPDRVRALLEEMRRGHGIAAVSPHYQHRAGGAGPPALISPLLAPVPVTPLYLDGPGRAARSAYQALFDVPGVLNVGGCYGGYRLEHDNFLFHLMRMTGALTLIDRPLYHRADRSAAPRADEPAFFHPEVRGSAAATYTRLYAEAYHLYCEYLQGFVGYPVLCRQLRSLAWRHVSTSEWDTLRAEASRLRWQVKATLDPGHGAGRAGPRRARPRAVDGAQTGERLLTAYTVPAGSLSARTALAGSARPALQPALPVITGILTARSQADLGPDAITHPLLPHDATVMLERTGADMVLIEAAAMLPGSAWAYAANPAAADRGRRLADLIDAAHADGKPVVFLRNLPRDRIPGLGWLEAMCDAVVPGGLGVQLARFNPIDRPARRASGPLYMAARDPREPVVQRRLLDQLTGGKRPAVRVADVPWRELPDWYRRHAVFLAASAGQARKQRACGARVIAPLGPDGAAQAQAAVDAAAVLAQLNAARATGVPHMTEVRQVLREIFEADATPVRLIAIARLAGLRVDAPASRQIAVLAAVRDAAEAARMAHQLLRQRLRPAEVVAFGAVPPPAAAPPGGPAGSGAADHDHAIARALGVLAAAGITVRIAARESQREAARRASLPWIAPWDPAGEHSDWYLLDLMCARECSRADVIGRARDADYVFADVAEPALARRELLTQGGPPQSWTRQGARTLSIAY